MTEANNNTNPPVSYDVAQRFLADYQLCTDFFDDHADDLINGSSKTPAHGKLLAHMMQSLLESSSMLIEEIQDHSPAEFAGHSSGMPRREMTESELQRFEQYLTTG